MGESRKLFVGGLSQSTNESNLTEYFSKYGEIESVDLKKDNVTQKSRGFGFVTFKDAQALDLACAEKFHTIDGKKIEPRKAKVQTSKLFVGGLKEELSDEDIKNHFSQFGNISDGEFPFDKSTSKRKGFCFLIFEGQDTAKKIIDMGKQTINGIEVDVKKAIPSDNSQGGGRGGRGGRGGGRGGFNGQQGGYGGGYDQYGYGGGYGDGYGYGGGYGDGYGYGGGYDQYGGGYDYSGYGQGGYGQGGQNGYGAQGGYGGQGNGTQNFGGGKAPRARGRGGNRGQPY